jgi:transposase-like protein
MDGKTHRVGPSIIQTAKDFPSEQACHDYLEAARWPEGVTCLKCQSDSISKYTIHGKTRIKIDKKTGKEVIHTGPDRFMYQCMACGYQFSTTTGTLFSDTKLPLRVWMQAVALLCGAKKGISAKQMERALDISYKTAWYLNHRIREAMADGDVLPLSGVVEVDESYLGGRAKNMHAKKRKEKIGGRGVHGKDTVFGMVERGGNVKTFHVPALNRFHVIDKIKEGISVEASLVCTDESQLYVRMPKNITRHEIVNHSAKEYVRGEIHTGTIDGFWGLLKRSIIGSFHRVSIKHLHRYLSESEFKWNNRENHEVFLTVILGLVINGALRYKKLTGPEVPALPASDDLTLSDDEPF